MLRGRRLDGVAHHHDRGTDVPQATETPRDTMKQTDSLPAERSRSWGVLTATAAYVVSRFLLYACFSAASSDVFVYFHYSVAGVDDGLTPYRDIQKLEYPPTAYWVVCLPRLLTYEPGEKLVYPTVTPEQEELYDKHLRRYDLAFRGLMLLFDAGSFWLLLAIAKRRSPARRGWVAWGFVLTTSLLGYVLLERLDVAVTASILAWAYCGLRADEDDERGWLWMIVGYAALGFGVSYKLIPVLLVPFSVWADVVRMARKPRAWRLLWGWAMLVVAAVGPFAYYYSAVGNDLGRMFQYHSVRGVEIESVAATAMMIGEKRADLGPYFDYGSWNLSGRWERPLVTASTFILLGLLGVLGLRAVAAPFVGERYDRAAAYRFACVAIAAALVAAKVFSVQYLCWGLPLLILAAADLCRERSFRGIVVASVFMAALTAFIFPCHFVDQMFIWPYSKENLPPWLLIEFTRWGVNDGKEVLVGTLSTHGPPLPAMIARNALFVVSTAMVFVEVLKRRR